MCASIALININEDSKTSSPTQVSDKSLVKISPTHGCSLIMYFGFNKGENKRLWTTCVLECHASTKITKAKIRIY